LPGLSPASLEDCLADQRLILPGEHPQAYEALAREVWAAFAPANLLEAFITTDYLQTQWRLNRVPRIEQALFERLAVSTTGDHCGIGFAFIHDSQRHQVLETLGHYEAILRKRLEKRLALFRRLRQEGWNEAVCPRPEPGAQSQPIPPVGDAFVSSSTPTLPTPGPTPEPAPVAPIVEAQLEPTQPALGPIASAGSVADSRPAAAPHDSTAGPVNPPAS
jgi:hypothetical protein